MAHAGANKIPRHGLNDIAEAYVVPAILGKTNDIWDLVGRDD